MIFAIKRYWQPWEVEWCGGQHFKELILSQIIWRFRKRKEKAEGIEPEFRRWHETVFQGNHKLNDKWRQKKVIIAELELGNTTK